MRIKFKKDKQKELILKAKGKMTWKELGNRLGIAHEYLCNDLRSEKKTISEELYHQLCSIAKTNFDNFIDQRLDENWGKSRGGINSLGSTKDIKSSIKKDAKLAELVGVILGDGNITFYKKGKRVGVYHIKIAGDLNKDRDYHLFYVKPLCEEIFGITAKEMLGPNERFISIYSKRAVEFLKDLGLMPGNKMKNQSTIPNWILVNARFIRACLRGLIDTDGSIHRMSRKNPNLLRIDFTNHNKTLLNDARKAFIELGFSPSNIILERRFCLSRKSEIERYLKEIGFLNKKHIKRLQEFKKSPMV